MGKRTTIAVALLTCLTVFSCGSKSDIKTKEAADDMTSPVTNGEKIKDMVGQPGLVTITGQELMAATGKLDEASPKKITIRTSMGFDAEGKQFPAISEAVLLIPKADASVEESLVMAEQTKTFINLGCDITKRTDLAGLEEQKVEASKLEEIATLTADTILLCGTTPIKAQLISLTAKTVILNNVQQNMVGGVESLFAIRAREISLTGTNLLTSQAKKSMAKSNSREQVTEVLSVGPSISLTAEKLSGEGFIQINSIGESAPAKVIPASKPEIVPTIMEASK